MSPSGNPEQERRRRASHLAGHVTVYYGQWGRMRDLSINQSGRLIPCECGSFFKRNEWFRFENRNNNLPVLIAGPLGDAWYNKLDFKQTLEEYPIRLRIARGADLGTAGRRPTGQVVP